MTAIYGWGARTAQQSLQSLGGLQLKIAQTLTQAGSNVVLGNGPYAADTFGFTRLQAALVCTSPAQSASDTCDVFIDCSPDDGTTWVNVIHFAQLLGNGGTKKYAARTPAAAAGSIGDVTADLAAAATPTIPFGGDFVRARATTVNTSGTCSFPLAITLLLLP